MAAEQLYTSGSWTVVPGREDDFVAAWTELAEWTAAEVPGSSWATLIQRKDMPNCFVSFGPWRNAEAIDEWRASDGFQRRVGALREMLEDFSPGVFAQRAHVEPSD
jgi:quinol monooxygenase YgiN